MINLSCVLSEEVVNRIRHHAKDAEQDGLLHRQQLDVIYEQRWFRMFVPKSFGGLELSLPEVLRTEEALAWVDGSTAWVVTLCSGAGWFIGFMDSELTAEIFSSNTLCLAGSGAATGTATHTTDGYVINGQWKYASGALHATALTANCVMMKGGRTLHNADGTPVVKAFIFRKDEVEIQRDWNSMGMKATGSHSFRIQGVHVPKNRTFTIHPENARLPHPIYQYPFLQLAETTLAVNYLGLAQRFVELCSEGEGSDRSSAQGQNMDDVSANMHRQQERLVKSRTDFYNAVDESWSYCVRMERIPDEVLTMVTDASRALYRTSLAVAGALYPYGGMAAADLGTEINRVWRNLFTASQHSLFSRHA